MSLFKTNSFGCRDDEYISEKHPNTIRGAFIGDSFTMGSGINIEDTYHSQLERSLNSQDTPYHFEFINFGVGGYNLFNYLGVLENKIMPFDPDFIVIGFCANNDYRVPNKRHYEGNYAVKPASLRAFFKPYFIHLTYAALFSKKTKPLIELTSTERDFINEMFEEHSAFSQKTNIPIIINFLSNKPADKILDVVEKTASENNLYFLNSSQQFTLSDYKTNRVNVFDHHPNAAANTIFAHELLNFDPFVSMIHPVAAK